MMASHAHLYLKEDKHIYMSDAWVCNEYLKSYAYNVSGNVLCLYADECWGRTGFIAGDYCYTAHQCRVIDNSYAYMAFKGCRQNPPDQFSSFDRGQWANEIYDCGDDYLNIIEDTWRCTTLGACPALPRRFEHLCLTPRACGESYGYLY